MIKHILKIIWNQRRSNGWIFAELLVVVAILWVMMDSMLVDQYTYHSPLGFDIRNTYKIQLGEYFSRVCRVTWTNRSKQPASERTCSAW